jgi:hypothetical protein
MFNMNFFYVKKFISKFLIKFLNFLLTLQVAILFLYTLLISDLSVSCLYGYINVKIFIK